MGAHGGNLALGPCPDDCQIALGSCGRLLGRYEVNRGAQHLTQELVRPVALALEISPVTCGGGFDFGQLGLQRFDPVSSVRSTKTRAFPSFAFCLGNRRRVGERSGSFRRATQTLP